jgi:hypothetical protein
MHSVNGQSQKRKCLSVNDMVCCLFRRGSKVRVFHFVGIATELLPCIFSLYSSERLMWMFMVLPCWLCWKGKVIEPLNAWKWLLDQFKKTNYSVPFVFHGRIWPVFHWYSYANLPFLCLVCLGMPSILYFLTESCLHNFLSIQLNPNRFH